MRPCNVHASELEFTRRNIFGHSTWILVRVGSNEDSGWLTHHVGPLISHLAGTPQYVCLMNEEAAVTDQLPKQKFVVVIFVR